MNLNGTPKKKMSRDEERLDASATRDVPWTTDSDSEPAAARALVTLFPSLPSSRAWLLYDSLLRAVVRARGPAAASRRRVLAAQIPGVVARKMGNSAARAYVGSLLAMLIDPIPIPPPPEFPGVPCPLVSSRMRVPVPEHSGGSSCFCDVVLVAMFLGTSGYDELLFRKASSPVWQDALVDDKAIPSPVWVHELRWNLEINRCFARHKYLGMNEEAAEKATLEDIKGLQRLLAEGIAGPMRTLIPKDLFVQESHKIGESVIQLRKRLRDCGFMGVGGAQEDSEELFNAILYMGEWNGLFWPILRKTLKRTITGTVRGQRLEKSIPPRTTVTIDVTFLFINFPPDPLGSVFPLPHLLQHLLDDAYSSSSSTDEVEKELGEGDFDYIRENLQSLTHLTDDELGAGDLEIQYVSKERLLRVPDPFAFSLRRMTHEHGAAVRKENLVLLPDDHVIEVPSPGGDLRYRIFAIACQEGTARSGHYTLYFRCSGSPDPNSWYYYNDMGPKLTAVDMGNEKRKNFISKNAYLFWAERIA